jgi:hypothetical protein
MISSARLPASVLDLPLLATPRQAAHVLGLTDGQMRSMIASLRIAHIVIGKRSVVPRDAIERFIAENTVQPCRDAIKDQSFDTSKSAKPTTSFGRREVVVASAARVRAIAEKLKFSARSFSGSGTDVQAQAIQQKS